MVIRMGGLVRRQLSCFRDNFMPTSLSDLRSAQKLGRLLHFAACICDNPAHHLRCGPYQVRPAVATMTATWKGIHAVTVVPCWGFDSTVSSPSTNLSRSLMLVRPSPSLYIVSWGSKPNPASCTLRRITFDTLVSETW